MTNKEKALEMHKQWNGKLSVEAKCQVASAEDLAIAYTPGVAEPCRAIAKNAKESYTYTIKANTHARATWLPLYQTEALYLVLVISVPLLPCLLWKERLPFLKNSAV